MISYMKSIFLNAVLWNIIKERKRHSIEFHCIFFNVLYDNTLNFSLYYSLEHLLLHVTSKWKID